MKLSMVIPAYNEEEAIAAIIERCLAARPSIIRDSPCDDVEIIVVNDGSTDRTGLIAASYRDIHLVQFDRNRGYGAAIKAGFAEASGEWLGFLDADGTCDPRFFADLCRAVADEEADAALGSRMHADSRMPALRRLGNRCYALLLSVLSNTVVTDTSSGMRVLRREAFEQLGPLPDGLHFTPAISARMILDRHWKLVERPMPYHERVGRSKLSVVRDGFRFLKTILESAARWNPQRLLHGAGLFCLAVSAILGIYPLEHWIRYGTSDAASGLRLWSSLLLTALAVICTGGGVLCRQLDFRPKTRLPMREPNSYSRHLLNQLFSVRGLGCAAGLGVVLLLLAGSRSAAAAASPAMAIGGAAAMAGVCILLIGNMMITAIILNLLRHRVQSAGTAGEPHRGSETRSMPVTRIALDGTPVEFGESRRPLVPSASPAELAKRSSVKARDVTQTTAAT